MIPLRSGGRLYPPVRALFAAGYVLTLAGAARAQQAPVKIEPEPVLIVVDAPDGCITSRDFLSEVRRRTVRVRAAEPGEPARSFTLSIRTGAPVVGVLSAENGDGTTTRRVVEGVNCREVADALALVLAVTLDPFTDPSRAPAAIPSDRAASEPTSPRAALTTTAVAQPPAAANAGSGSSWQQAFGAEATLVSGLFHTPLVGLGARYIVAPPSKRPAPLLLTAGAFVSFGADAPADYAAGGVVRYHLQGISAGVCPVGIRPHPRVRVYPCGALTLGRLQAEGVGLPNQQGSAIALAAGSLEGRGVIHVAGPVGLVASAGLSMPIGKYQTTVTGADRPVSVVSRLGFVGQLGVVLGNF